MYVHILRVVLIPLRGIVIPLFVVKTIKLRVIVCEWGEGWIMLLFYTLKDVLFTLLTHLLWLIQPKHTDIRFVLLP